MAQLRNPKDGGIHMNQAFEQDEDASVVPKVSDTTVNEEEYYKATVSLRFFLRFFFYSPIHFRDKRLSIHLLYLVFMVIQLCKLIMTTVLMFQFGLDRGNFTEVVGRGHLTLRHLLLKEWTPFWETLPYPPSSGPFAVYNIRDLEERINFAVTRVYNAPNDASGFYRLTDKAMQVNMKYFDFAGLTLNSTGVNVKEIVFNITAPTGPDTYNIIDDFQRNNVTDALESMLQLNLKFEILSLRVAYDKVSARCLHINGEVIFEDHRNNGQVLVSLETLTTRIACDRIAPGIENSALENTSASLTTIALLFVCVSLVQGMISVGLLVFVFCKTKQYMRKYYNIYFKPAVEDENDVPAAQYCRFLKRWAWDLIVIIADVMTVTTLVNILWSLNAPWTLELLDSLSVRLGTANIISWMTVLQFFRFNKKFDLLFSTLYGAFWDVMAFLTCVTVLFMAFWACGYVVLGPYHIKFSTPSKAMETLFAVSTGDELYATLNMLEVDKTGGTSVRIFSRFYLITYVSIFTLVAINLLIALFNNAYETVRASSAEKTESEREEGPLETALRRYLDESVSQPLRVSLYDILDDRTNVSKQESIMKKELSRFVRKAKDTREVEVIKAKPRKLRTIMNDPLQGDNPWLDVSLKLFSCYHFGWKSWKY